MLSVCVVDTDSPVQNLCFTKKIRYESRKQLAQARPRVKGQFVRVRSEDVDEVVNALTTVQKVKQPRLTHASHSDHMQWCL